MGQRKVLLVPVTVILVYLLQGLQIINFGEVQMPLSWMGYLLLMLISLLAVDAWQKFKLSPLRWIYLAFAAHILVFGSAIIFNWYNLSPIVNRLEHILGSFILTWATWIVLQNMPIRQNLSALSLLLFCFGVVNLLAVTNEVVELAIDYLFQAGSIGPELWDTNLDLLMNWVGILGFYGILHYLPAQEKVG